MGGPVTAWQGFVARHDLWTPEQHDAAQQAARAIEEVGVDLVRVVFPDMHGLLRGKTLTLPAYEAALLDGQRLPSSLVLKDTSGRSVYPVFEPERGLADPRLAGASDLVMVPDPTTFRVLPWAPRTAWVLSDVYFPDGAPVPFAPRHVARRVLDDLRERGWDLLAGVELELHVFRAEDGALEFPSQVQPADAPAVTPLDHGFQLLSEERIDRLDPLVQALHGALTALGLGLRSIEVEYGPSQLEITLDAQRGLRPADDVVLVRSAVRQVCRRHGYHATFMARPALPHVLSSGWHLHQSLVEAATGRNLFTSDGDGLLSELATHYLGGLLAHADAAAVFTTPTINGYKRYRPYSLAPDRRVWGEDNKGAMIRAVGVPGDPGTRLENRSGEPAANPYLYLASQVAAGLDGIDRALDPGPPTAAPYAAEAPRLPASLDAAVEALADDKVFAERLGADTVAHVLAIKRFELARFRDAVTDWEQREYFDTF